MVALLALCPIALKNFAGLEIGAELCEKFEGAWWIVLDDTKSRRPDHRSVPYFLTGHIECYLDVYRPILLRYSVSDCGFEYRRDTRQWINSRQVLHRAGPTETTSAFWISRFGRPSKL